MLNKKSVSILHLGSNLGDRHTYLNQSKQLISNTIGTITKQSKLYNTAAWGNENQADFLNQAITVETFLSPFELLENTQKIEHQLSRKRHKKWAPRTIDIDILFYDSQVIDTPHLKIPHPLIAQRNFVLVPLLDIVADFIHPILQVPIETLYWESEDTQEVWIHE